MSVWILLIAVLHFTDAAPQTSAIYNMTSSPNSRVKYSFNTIQTGTAHLQRDKSAGRVFMDPKSTKHYLSQTETNVGMVIWLFPLFLVAMLLFFKTFMQTTRNWRKPKTLRREKDHAVDLCVRCPPERTFVAQQRLDGVLLPELPPFSSCSMQPASNIFKLQSLFDSNFKFILPAGSHTFLAHIVNTRTGNVERNCNLRFNVVVRRCSPYRVRSNDLLAKCDLDNIWGSMCSFSCAHAEKLSHTDPIICNDDLQWTGEEPVCVPHKSNQLKQRSCEMPEAPANARIRCEIDDNQTAIVQENDTNSIFNGSRCHVVCNSGYGMPPDYRSSASIQCRNGKWNSSIRHVCRTFSEGFDKKI